MNSEYIYVWQPVQSGIYSSKSGYNDATVTNKPRALNANQYFNWIANIWAGDFSSKAISFLMVSGTASSTHGGKPATKMNSVKYIMSTMQGS